MDIIIEVRYTEDLEQKFRVFPIQFISPKYLCTIISSRLIIEIPYLLEVSISETILATPKSKPIYAKTTLVGGSIRYLAMTWCQTVAKSL